MTGRLAWYVARASGIVAVGLCGATVLWGLLVSTRFLRRPGPRWFLDLHRMLGGLAVVFTGVHLAGLVADNYVQFGPADLLVPFASSWHPAAVALGVVALWLLVAVEVTSLLMRHLPRRAWRAVHVSSHALFWLAILHGATAGTDTTNRAYRTFAVIVVAAWCYGLVYRRLVATSSARRDAGRPEQAVNDGEQRPTPEGGTTSRLGPPGRGGDGTRTHDLRLAKPSLSPAELRPRSKSRVAGNDSSR